MMNKSEDRYVVATIKDWNIKRFKHQVNKMSGQWHLVTQKENLNSEFLLKINPRYIFFPHWSWIVPDEVVNNYECVCFHMTDLPYGRGGSPLQNLIARGHKETQLTALKMTSELDAGDIYIKEPLSLNGSAQQIYERASDLIFELIAYVVKSNPKPQSQFGNIVCFERRKPAQSQLPKVGTELNLYDHIRMLDADSYPKAFIEYGNFVLEFEQANINDGVLQARVSIQRK